MISALIGAVIMSAVTVAMVIAVKVSDNAIKNVGKYPMTQQEREILKNARYDENDIENINEEIKQLNFNE